MVRSSRRAGLDGQRLPNGEDFGMNRFGLILLCLGVVAAALWGCTSPQSPAGAVEPEVATRPVRLAMRDGDRQREWALVFFQSWRIEHNGTYLKLSRHHMAKAVKTYFALQVRIGHSFPDFYDLDRRRRQGCRFLAEIDTIARKFRVPLADRGREGCFRVL